MQALSCQNVMYVCYDIKMIEGKKKQLGVIWVKM